MLNLNCIFICLVNTFSVINTKWMRMCLCDYSGASWEINRDSQRRATVCATGCRIVFECTILSSPCTVSEESVGSSQRMWKTLKNSQQDKVSLQKDVVAPQAQQQLTTKSAWVRGDSTLGHNICTHHKDGCGIGTVSLADVCSAERIEGESSLNKTLSRGFSGNIRGGIQQCNPPGKQHPAGGTTLHQQLLPRRLLLMLSFYAKCSVITRLTLCISSIITKLGGS